MHRVTLLSSLTSIFLAATGCATGKMAVRYEAARDFPAAGHQSFRIVDHDIGTPSEAVLQLVEEELRATMLRKGYREAATGDADLAVSVKVLLGKTQGAPPAGTVGTGAGADVVVASGTAQDKVLLILIQDARSMRSVWVGWSQGKVPTHALGARIKKAVTSLVAEIPQRGAQRET